MFGIVFSWRLKRYLALKARAGAFVLSQKRKLLFVYGGVYIVVAVGAEIYNMAYH